MNVLIIDKLDPSLEQQFHDAGWTTEVDLTSEKETIAKQLHLYQGLIVRSRFPIDADFIEKGTNLKFIGRPGAGLENIDTTYCEKKGITCFRSPEGNCDALGEHTVGMLLALLHNFRRGDVEVRQGIWDRKANTGSELGGKVVAIIGYGYMGAAFAKRLRGFDVNLLVYDKFKKGFGDTFIKETSLKDIFENADIVSIHTPLTDETKGMVNLDFYRKFKKPIVVINTARGPILKLNDLATAMQQGLVKGACLDVLEHESNSFGLTKNSSVAWQYLTQSSQVIFTPHVAGITHESEHKMAHFLAEKILRVFR